MDTPSVARRDLLCRIQTLLMNNTELENRLKSERNLMKSQLHTKEERLQTLLAENSHTREILKRNSELEETSAKEKKEIEGWSLNTENLHF